MKDDLIWSLRIEGVTEIQIRQMKVKDVKHSGVIFVMDSNSGRKVNFLLSDRVNSKLINFIRNKKSEELLFPEDDAYTTLTSINKQQRTNRKQRVCFAD